MVRTNNALSGPESDATSEVFWLAFNALPKREREAVVKRLLRDKKFVKDVIDTALIERRRNEPSRDLDDYLADKKKKADGL